ncbi:MAG: protein kinase [Rhodospirillales bacterium]|nr:protein kinase [Rhodospirillales bacterium]
MSIAAIRILVVDRDPKYREWLRLHLGILYPDAMVSTAAPEDLDSRTGADGCRSCDVLILTGDFGSGPDEPRPEGLRLLRRLRAGGTAPVLVLAERGDELTAVQAIRAGATDYVPKRLLNPARLRSAVDTVLEGIERPAQAADTGQTTRNFAVSAPRPPGPMPERTPMGEPHCAEPASTESAAAAGAEAAAQPDSGAAAAPPEESGTALSAPDRRGTAPAKPRASERPRIADYAIARKIGESEKAVVYLAESGRLRTEVALKVSKIPCEGRARQALEREYQAIHAVHDPAVVHIFDHGVAGGYEYLAMEYFPLGDLKARMQAGVSEREALKFLEKIAAALRVVHRAGLLHRDLKPPNVMLRDTDNIVLIDFGLARLLEGTHHSTYTGVLRGSPYYMSPEQALGEELDPRSDLYSLGVIFHEMLTGRKPFTGASAMEVLQQHVNSSPPHLPPALSRYSSLLARLLAKKREQRFAGAEELIAAIASLGNRRLRRAQSAA